MKSSTIPDAGAIDTGPSAPSEIFLNENKGPIEFWVHPNYPSRTVIISAIKAHGGVVTDDFESAHFAVLSEEMSLTQWEAGKWSDSNIIAISGTWIAECLNNGAQISNEDYVIWSPRSHEPSAFHVANSGDPKPGTRTQDEYFFLWACEKLMNENPHIQWAGIYRWCAKKTRARPEWYWANLNTRRSTVRSKAERIYRSVVATKNSDPSKQVADLSPPQSSTDTPAKHSRRGRPSYSEAEHLALIKYLATDPVGSKNEIFDQFHEMHPRRSAAAWKTHAYGFGGFFWEQAARMKAGVPYQLFPSHPIERSKSGAIEGSDEDNQTQDRPSSVPDSDTSYDMEEGDRDESDVHSAVISSRRAQYARYTSEERRDMVMHLVANPATNWVNYSSKYTSRTPMSLFSYHRRHPSLDREAAELARHQKLNQDNRGGWDVAFLSEAGPSNSLRSRPPNRLLPTESLSLKATSTKRSRHSHIHHSHWSPAASTTTLEPSQPLQASPTRSQSQSRKFDKAVWKLAMEFVASRDPPEDPFENVVSWKAFAKKHTTLDLEGWLQLYYSDLPLFKSMEAHRAL